VNRRDRDDDTREQQEVEVTDEQEIDSATAESDELPGVTVFDEAGNVVSKAQTGIEDVEDIPGVSVRNRDRGADDDVVAEVETRPEDGGGNTAIAETTTDDVQDALDEVADATSSQSEFSNILGTTAATGALSGAFPAQESSDLTDRGDTTTTAPTAPPGPTTPETTLTTTPDDPGMTTPAPPGEPPTTTTTPGVPTDGSQPPRRASLDGVAPELKEEKLPDDVRIVEDTFGTGIGGAEDFAEFEETVLETDDPLGEVLGDKE
jgi:hypothetical protein